MWSRSLIVAGLALGWAGASGAQSITSAVGPGYPVLPTDARTAVLGGLGLGLHGFSAPLTNPAAVANITRRGAIVAVEAVERDIQIGDSQEGVGTTRFPLIRLVYPTQRAVFTAGYAAYLDQGWGLQREGEELLGDTLVGFTDVMRSDGGVGQFQVGAAVPIGTRLAVGGVVGLNMGSQSLQYTRRFDPMDDVFLDPYTEAMAWRYSGPMAQVGAQWDPADILRLGVSVTWSGTLVGDSTDGRAGRRELDLPLQVAGGASGVLVPGLMATLSARWSGWSVTDADAIGLPTAAARASRDTWEVGGGLEYAAVRPAVRRAYPLRVGFQYRQLPFPFGDEAPAEWFAGVGGGLRVGLDPRNPLATVDLAVQRGNRTAAGGPTLGDLTESMWRFSLSVSLFGN